MTSGVEVKTFAATATVYFSAAMGGAEQLRYRHRKVQFVPGIRAIAAAPAVFYQVSSGIVRVITHGVVERVVNGLVVHCRVAARKRVVELVSASAQVYVTFGLNVRSLIVGQSILVCWWCGFRTATSLVL